jgi:1-acyl-sn-glycerol-3-phosphate acyltransferase
LIFPQGYHATPAQEIAGDPIANFKVGVSHLVEALDATVVPFGVAGSEKVVPPDPEKHDGLKIAGIPVAISRGPMAIVFGAPVRMEAGESTSAFAARLQAICYPLTRRAEAALAGDPVVNRQ